MSALGPPLDPQKLRIVIVGSGMAGGTMAAVLLRDPAAAKTFDVRVLERVPQGKLPLGLNLTLNHNALSCLREHAPNVATQLEASGLAVTQWRARTMTGSVLYDMPDITQGDEALALHPGVRARWDKAQQAVHDCCPDSTICWGVGVDSVVPVEAAATESGRASLRVQCSGAALAGGGALEADLVVAGDGRYSALRAASEGGAGAMAEQTGFMDVANFRLVVPDATGGLIDDIDRLYNVPSLAHLDDSCANDEEFVTECMGGVARVGVVKLRGYDLEAKPAQGVYVDDFGVARPNPTGEEAAAAKAPAIAQETTVLREDGRMVVMRQGDHDIIGMFGNVRIKKGGQIPPCLKTPAGLRSLLTPPGGEGELDAVGRFVFDSMMARSDELHWARFQEAPTRFVGMDGRVLFLGDSAHPFCPSMGLGSSMAIEDACVAAAVLLDAATVLSAANDGAALASRVPELCALVAELRTERTQGVAKMSADHALHLAAAAGDAASSIAAETADWLGSSGGFLSPADEPGSWRARLSWLWSSGWPRRAAVEAAVRAKVAPASACASM